MRAALWIVVAGLAVTGCGGEERQVTSTPDPTKTATPTATDTPDPAPPERARSAADCLKLWNADEALGSTQQVSHTEFVAELARKARTPILVDYQRPHCFVVAPIGPRRIAWFTAANGRAPYSVPQRRNLKPGERLRYNARALQDGRIEPR